MRGLVIAAGALVVVASLLAFRLADWPLYLAYVLTAIGLYPPRVEVLPGMTLTVPALAVTIGFVYIAGLPIVVLCSVPALVFAVLHHLLPERWRTRLPQVPYGSARSAGGHASWLEDFTPSREALVDWGSFAVGLGIRWWAASAVMSEGRPYAEAYAITVGEVAGYAFWSLLATLPVYSFIRPVLTPDHKQRAAQQDLALIMPLALTPFVFLIAYGYHTHGLEGAIGWSVGSCGVHLLLKRLTERRRTVEAQNRSLETLNRELADRERLSAIGKMSSVVSHQILHQLGVIGIYADLIRNTEAPGGADDAMAQARAQAGAIEDALGDVNRVLRELLVFGGDLRLNLYAHPLASVIAECVAGCRAETDERGIEVRVDCPRDLTLPLDKIKMTHVMTNLLRNAVQVSPPGSEITIAVEARDDWVEIAVGDAGPGVTAEHRGKVFTPFFTTKDEGIGLGLAIAREFTEAHAGSIRIEDTQRQGATFVVRLPCGNDPVLSGMAG